MVKEIYRNKYIIHFIIFFLANILTYPFFQNRTLLDMFVLSFFYAFIWWLWDSASSLKKKKHES